MGWREPGRAFVAARRAARAHRRRAWATQRHRLSDRQGVRGWPRTPARGRRSRFLRSASRRFLPDPHLRGRRPTGSVDNRRTIRDSTCGSFGCSRHGRCADRPRKPTVGGGRGPPTYTEHSRRCEAKPSFRTHLRTLWRSTPKLQDRVDPPGTTTRGHRPSASRSFQVRNQAPAPAEHPQRNEAPGCGEPALMACGEPRAGPSKGGPVEDAVPRSPGRRGMPPAAGSRRQDMVTSSSPTAFRGILAEKHEQNTATTSRWQGETARKAGAPARHRLCFFRRSTENHFSSTPKPSIHFPI